MSSLQKVIEDAEIMDAFYADGPLTLLAPNNGAFEMLTNEYPDLNKVLFTKPWELHLLDLLFSHVIEDSAIFSADLKDGDVATTSSGQDITVVAQNGGNLCFMPSLDDEACVVVADFIAKNGVAHIVEGTITSIKCCAHRMNA